MIIYRVWMDSESFENGWEFEGRNAKDAVQDWVEQADKPDDYCDDEDGDNLVNVAVVTYPDLSKPDDRTAIIKEGTHETWLIEVELVPTLTFRKM